MWRANRYRRGDVLFYEGNMPSSVYFLCKGRVKLVRDDRAERCHILRVFCGPDIFGERALLAEQPYAASAQVMEDSLICALDAESFFELWRVEPELSRMFSRHLARKLAEADGATFNLAQRTILERLAGLIVSRLESSGGAMVRFSESRRELADLLGTSAEAVSRGLSELARKNLVSIEGRRLRVLDEARLRYVGHLPPQRHDFYHGPACVPAIRAARSEPIIALKQRRKE
ncbi:MAG: Crp/Fnr family transcriptional regulator [Elusimicrobia bacterium]|nr:Crp/Fnr family transcriptional regulator [Elusimicrobiota bacterium]